MGKLSHTRLKKLLNPVFSKYPIIKAALFGSYATNTSSADSDIDIIIDDLNKLSLFEISQIKSELEEILNIKVDLTTYYRVNKYYKPKIVQEQKVIFEKVENAKN